MRYPIGFSTLGCPKWPWPKILEQAAAIGYVEPSSFEASRATWTCRSARSWRRGVWQACARISRRPISSSPISARRLACTSATRASGTSSSTKPAASSISRTTSELPTSACSRTTILTDEPHEVTLARIGDTLAELGWFAKGSGVGVLVESHGDLTDSNRPRAQSCSAASRRQAWASSGTRTTPSSRAREARPTRGRRSASGSITRTSRTRSPTARIDATC